MLAFNHSMKIYLAVQPVDMRKQFDGLWSVAEQHLKLNPYSGSVFLFTNKRRNRLKILYWDGSGVWVFAKRLEKGRLSWPKGSDERRLCLTPQAVGLLIEGIDLKDGHKKAWYEA